MRKTIIALAATTAFTAPAFAQDMNIIETAVGAGNFTTLVAASSNFTNSPCFAPSM